MNFEQGVPIVKDDAKQLFDRYYLWSNQEVYFRKPYKPFNAKDGFL